MNSLALYMNIYDMWFALHLWWQRKDGLGASEVSGEVCICLTCSLSAYTFASQLIIKQSNFHFNR